MVAEEYQSAKDKETVKAATSDLSDEGTKDDLEKVDLDQENPSDDIPYPLSKPSDTADLDETLPIIPVIIGATGIVDKNLKKYVGRIPGCHNIYSLQRSAILGTAHILRKVMSIKPD